MAYLLGYGTAVEWLRQNRNTALVAERFALPMLSLEGSRHRLHRHDEELADLTLPLQLVVSTRDARRPSAYADCHLFTTPDGTYLALRVARGVFCCDPATVFLQMTGLLDEDALCFLGMELCGRYGISADGRIFLRNQTCSASALAEAAHAMGSMRGIRRMRAAIPRIMDGAASPMEIALALILCETVERGGYGLPRPTLNRSIHVKGRARDLWDDDFIIPDLLWEEGMLALEYDSDLMHTASRRIARDASRRNVLEELGYRVVTVTTEHLRTPREMERIAGIVARSLGCELPEVDAGGWARRMAWQLRMRHLGEHPEELLGFSDAKRPRRRAWRARSGFAYAK